MEELSNWAMEKKLSSLETYRADALEAADGLLYNDKVKDQLKEAKTEGEILTIMANARREKFG